MSARRNLIQQGAEYLAKGGSPSPLRETELFLSHVLNCPRIELYLDDAAVAEKKRRYFWQLLNLRAQGLPLQYLTGSTEFMGLEFKVAAGVFIPRPETELLVEIVLGLALSNFSLPLNILDVGTGCGNIAISLGRFLRKANIFASDISEQALQLARENARLNRVKIKLVKSDLFSAFKQGALFSLLVSNPPYICSPQIPGLPRELQYEPRCAYDGGEDGLCYLRRIIQEAPHYLRDEGILALEIGEHQAAEVETIFARSGRFSLLKVAKDYRDMERVILARKKK